MMGPKEKAGVSEVIGVVLMVAITVIIAAIVANTAMNLGNDLEEDVTAGVSVEFDPGNDRVNVNWVANRNAEFVNVTFTWGAGNSCWAELNNPGDRMSLGTSTPLSASGGVNTNCDSVTLPSDGDEVTVNAVAGNRGNEGSTVVVDGESGQI